MSARAIAVLALLAVTLALPACSKDQDTAPPAHRSGSASVAVKPAPEPPPPPEPAGNAPSGEPASRSRDLGVDTHMEGMEHMAAPFVYGTMVLRTRGLASDRTKEAIATRTVALFKATHENRLPNDMDELNKWLEEGGDAPLATPDRGGVYYINQKTGKVVIVDRSQLPATK